MDATANDTPEELTTQVIVIPPEPLSFFLFNYYGSREKLVQEFEGSTRL